jgi:hypothetical protein
MKLHITLIKYVYFSKWFTRKIIMIIVSENRIKSSEIFISQMEYFLAKRLLLFGSPCYLH